jgi:hypothetical protein
LKHTRLILASLALLLFSVSTFGQSKVEKDLLKEGNKLFEDRKVSEALPKFRQLLSIAPTNRDYNFKYGACLLSSDEDVEESIKHLKFSVKGGGGNPLAHYFLGRAYHLNYQFQDAIGAYRKFDSLADSKLKEEFNDGARLVSMAENGQTLLSKIKDISVIDKSESSVSDFFRSYDMDGIGGKVITVPDELLSAVDKKKGHRPLIHFPDNGTEILFSSYGSSGKSLDIYTATRQSSGKFSNPKKLAGSINSEYDEDYPFMHSDGVTLYFSSKGHNSMGGYDVFRAVKDANTGAFGKPENLDFAISSPDDDIFYMVDSDGQLANFASARSSEDGRLHVYRVKVKASAMNLAIIKGDFENEIGSSKEATIKVVDATNNKEIASYNTSKSTGEYLIDLPKSGKYKFFVEAKDSELTHTGMVDLPMTNGMKAFKQEMSLVEVGGQEKLVIKNLFDEPVDEDIIALAQRLLKEKAELDINSEADEPLVAGEEVDLQRAVQGAGFPEGTTIDEVLALSEQQVNELTKSIADNEVDAQKALAYADLNRKKSKELSDKAAKSFNQVDSQADQSAKDDLLVYTSSLKEQSNYFKDESNVALSLLDDIEQDRKNKQSRLSDLNERNIEVKEVMNSGNQSEIIAALTKIKQEEQDSNYDDALDFVSNQAIDRKKEAERTLKFSDGLRESEKELQGTLLTRRTQLEKTKNKKQRALLETEIVDITNEIEDYQGQIERSFVKLETVQQESEFSNRSVSMLEGVRMGSLDEKIASIPLRPVDKIITSEIDMTLKEVAQVNTSIAVTRKDVQEIFVKRPDLKEVYVQEMTLAGVPREISAFEYSDSNTVADSESTTSSDTETVNTTADVDDVADLTTNEVGRASDAVEETTSDEVDQPG